LRKQRLPASQAGGQLRGRQAENRACRAARFKLFTIADFPDSRLSAIFL
jgi:hypothetical protein